MIYFYDSTSKKDKLSHPVIVCAKNEHKAFMLAINNFFKHDFKGTPRRVLI